MSSVGGCPTNSSATFAAISEALAASATSTSSSDASIVQPRMYLHLCSVVSHSSRPTEARSAVGVAHASKLHYTPVVIDIGQSATTA